MNYILRCSAVLVTDGVSPHSSRSKRCADTPQSEKEKQYYLHNVNRREEDSWKLFLALTFVLKV